MRLDIVLELAVRKGYFPKVWFDPRAPTATGRKPGAWVCELQDGMQFAEPTTQGLALALHREINTRQKVRV